MRLTIELRLHMQTHRPLIYKLKDLPVCAETVGGIYLLWPSPTFSLNLDSLPN